MKKNSIIILSLLLLLGAIAVVTVMAKDKTYSAGDWTLSIDSDMASTLSYDGRVILNANKAVWGNGENLSSFADLTDVTITSAPVTDVLGSATEVSISGRDAQGNTVTHRYCLYGSENFVTTDIAVTAANGTVAYNYMSPVTTNASATMPDATDNVALFVPFDNDDFISYSTSTFETTHPASYEVTALFNKASRNAIVLGSITHDHWKTGINVATSGNDTISSICAFGGITSYETRDYLPHGAVKGETVKSPRIMIGCFDDWRTGMETYGTLCAAVAPKLPWNAPKPFAWNSWATIADKITYDKATQVSKYFAEKLPQYKDENGVAYIVLDSFWDRLTEEQLKQYVDDCNSRGQKAGIYLTPFAWWVSPRAKVFGTEYKAHELFLKDENGEPVKYHKWNAGGQSLDPTHPGTQQYFRARMQQFVDWGYEYVKLDFLSHGAMEGKFYNPDITTGIEAYNEGMKIAAEFGDRMHINLSIAPLFPAQYAHSRRISCDAWENISDTKYVLNSTTYGWWLDRCYSFNDGDHAKLYNPEGKTTENLNRCRLTSSVVTGYYLMGDDFSANGCSYAKERAEKLLTNTDVNEVVRTTTHAFSPVEAADGKECAEQYIYNDGENIYIAVYNFGETGSKTIDLARLGLMLDANYNFHELWSDTTTSHEGATFATAPIEKNDVHLYKVTKRR